MTTTPFSPTIRTQADLRDAWQLLMGPGAYSGHSVWMMLILDDHPFPHLTEITDAEEPPAAEDMGGLVELLRMLDREVAPGARVAFLRSRPGVGEITETDRAWAASLYAASRDAGIRCDVVHVATRGAVRAVPQDDVGLATSA